MNAFSVMGSVGLDMSGLTQGIRQAQTQVEQFAQRASVIGRTLSLGISAPLTAAGGAAVKLSGDLQQAVANISTIKPTIDTKGVFNALNEMQTRVPQTAKQLADSVYDIFSSVNVTQGQALKLVEQFAKGATAAGTDAKTFGTAVMGVMNAYHLSVDQATKVSDEFFNTVNAGVVTGPELAASLGPVTAAAKAAGVAQEQLFASIAAVTKEGGPAAQNINNLANVFQKLQTERAQKGIKALGVETEDAHGKFRPFLTIVDDVKTRLTGLSEVAKTKILAAIFPDVQARQGFQTLISQLDTAKEQLKVNESAAGATAAAYQKMSATFNSQATLLKNSFNAILTTIGANILPVITPLIKQFGEALPGAIKTLRGFLDSLPASVKSGAVAFAAFVAVIGPVIAAAGLVATAIGAIGAPVAIAIAAVVALAGAFAFNVGGIRDTALKVLGPVKDFIIQQFGIVKAWFDQNLPLIQRAVQTVLTTIRELWAHHGESVMVIVRGAWDVITTVVGTAIRMVLGVIRTVLQVITGDWSGAWESLKGVVQTAWDGIVGIVANLGPALLAAAKLAIGALWELGTRLGNAIWDGITHAADARREAAKQHLAAAVKDSVPQPGHGMGDLHRAEAAEAAQAAKEHATATATKTTGTVDLTRSAAVTKTVQSAVGVGGGKLSPAAREQEQYTQALEAAHARLSTLLAGEGNIAAQVAAQYGHLTQAQRAEMTTVLEKIAAREKETSGQQKYRAELQRVEAEIRDVNTYHGRAKVENQFKEGTTPNQRAYLYAQQQRLAAAKQQEADAKKFEAEQERAAEHLRQTLEDARLEALKTRAAFKFGELNRESLSLDQFKRSFENLSPVEQAAITQLYNYKQGIVTTKAAVEEFTRVAKARIKAYQDEVEETKWVADAMADLQKQLRERQREREKEQQDRFDEGIKKWSDNLKEHAAQVDEKIAAVADRTSDVFLNAFKNLDHGFKGFWKTLVKGFEDMLQEMAWAYLKSELKKVIFKLLGGQEMPGQQQGPGAGGSGGGGGGWAGIIQTGLQIWAGSQGGGAGAAAAGGGGGGFGGGEMSWVAAGGPIRAFKPYMVGERGPELIVPRHDGTVIPNHQLAAAGAGGARGGAPVHYHITQNISTPDVRGFRQNEKAIAADALRMARNIERRNG